MTTQTLIEQDNFKERLAKVRTALSNSALLNTMKCNTNFNPMAWKKMGLARWNRGGT